MDSEVPPGFPDADPKKVAELQAHPDFQAKMGFATLAGYLEECNRTRTSIDPKQLMTLLDNAYGPVQTALSNVLKNQGFTGGEILAAQATYRPENNDEQQSA